MRRQGCQDSDCTGAAYRGLSAAALLTMLVAGCAGGGSTASLGIPVPTELPKLPSLPAVRGSSTLPPTETYALAARGATSCWFGAGGVLKRSHIFYADADPPSSGGNAEIALHERVASAETPRGPKVFRVSFSSDAGGTRIEQTNHKLPAELAEALEADVARFVTGDLACASKGASAPRAEEVAAVPAGPARAKAKGGPAPKGAAAVKAKK